MSISLQDDDPWQLRPVEAGVRSPEHPALRIETIEGVEPLDAQLGAFPKKTVPDVLYDALFGQPEATAIEIETAGGDASAVPPMRTYAILDAAKVTNLPELLERSGLEHRCLFKGDAYDELRDVAPWIVQLEDDDGFTRNLFTRSDAPWHLWDTEPGIYVRSRGTLDEMWRHFRKFTRVQDESGKWFYWRFWESPVSTTFLSMGNSLEAMPLVSQIFSTNSRQIEIVASTLNGWCRLQPEGDAQLSSQDIRMRPPARALLRRLRQINEFEKLQDIAIRHVSKNIELNEDVARRHLRTRRDSFLSMGFSRRDHLVKLCCWELMLGPDFMSAPDISMAVHSQRPLVAPYELIDTIEGALKKRIAAEQDRLLGMRPYDA